MKHEIRYKAPVEVYAYFNQCILFLDTMKNYSYIFIKCNYITYIYVRYNNLNITLQNLESASNLSHMPPQSSEITQMQALQFV